MTSDGKPLPREDAIACLLKEAGLRAPVDRERTERVRAAVQAEWLETTRARTRRRTILSSAAALAAAASIFFAIGSTLRENVPAPPAPSVVVGVLEAVSGDVGAALGDEVFTGALLETGPNARAGLRLHSGPSLRLDAATRVQVESPNTFTLEDGAVYVDSGATESAIAVRTPLGIARDVGTQFEVRLRGDEVVIRVREGLVELTADDGVHQAPAGDELRMNVDGELVRGSVRPYAPQWDWTTRMAPPFELEGSSLASFLEWVSRERGWAVRFEDPELEAGTDAILLEGPVLNVPSHAALRTVLPACGLAHRIQNGELWIVEAR